MNHGVHSTVHDVEVVHYTRVGVLQRADNGI